MVCVGVISVHDFRRRFVDLQHPDGARRTFDLALVTGFQCLDVGVLEVGGAERNEVAEDIGVKLAALHVEVVEFRAVVGELLLVASKGLELVDGLGQLLLFGQRFEKGS